MPKRPHHRFRRRPPPLTEAQILAWADDHHARTGRWPRVAEGPVAADKNENWRAINHALWYGLRGLPGGDSLARLLARARGVRNRQGLPDLDSARILAWADAHRARTGRWPGKSATPGDIPEAPGERWPNVHQALKLGLRGLPGGDSLARLLARERGVPHPSDRPPLREAQIAAWARVHHRASGAWPGHDTGPVAGAPSETWGGIDNALARGSRGLPGDDSLARLLARRCGAPTLRNTSPLTCRQILAWADQHKARTGEWPRETSGPIPGAPGETWSRVQAALRYGGRGLPAGGSLVRLLAERRGVRNRAALPPLATGQILRWAKDHHRRTGRWPGQDSGPVRSVEGESWRGIEDALRRGLRGLPGGDSLARLLTRRLGAATARSTGPLSRKQILAWADAHKRRTGRWPRRDSGPVAGAPPGTTWLVVDRALKEGRRGLPGGTSLARLLVRCRGVRFKAHAPPLAREQILRWADAHRRRTGRWPDEEAGPILGDEGETWKAVDTALREGRRGLPGGDSIHRLLVRAGRKG
jgi:hypothetical protein